MHPCATTTRDSDTNWNTLLAPRKREARFRRQVSLLHLEFCDCPDYRNHFSPRPTTADAATQADAEEEHADGEDTPGELSDAEIIEAGAGIGGMDIRESR